MTQAQCKIRQAAIHEIPEIEQGCVEAYLEYRDHVPPEMFHAYAQDLQNLSRYWYETDVFVAEISGRIVGSIQFYPDASTEGLGLPRQWAGFRKLAVLPAARGRSVGRMLVEKCLGLAAARGVPAIGIHTASVMASACRLYEGLGFHRWPEHDLMASDLLGMEPAATDIVVLAYRLDLRQSRLTH